MNFDWFTLDWAKRWGLPVCGLALAGGMAVGAMEYRYNIPVITTPAQTITETPVPPIAVTETVVKTVTPAPERSVVTVVRTADPIAPATVTKTVEANSETTTVTKTEQPSKRELQVKLERTEDN